MLLEPTKLPNAFEAEWMDEEDEDLVAARNAPLPVASGYSKHLQPKSIFNLNTTLRSLTEESRKAEGKAAKALVAQQLKEVRFHLHWMESFGKTWDQIMQPLCDEPDKAWSSRTVQEGAIDTAKAMYKKHKLPLHVIVSKVHNRWSDAKKKMVRASANNSKQPRDDDSSASGPSAKKPRLLKGQDAQDKTKGSKVVNAGKGRASKGAAASKEAGEGKGKGGGKRQVKSSLRGKSNSTRVSKVGSDGAYLAVGGCVLGAPANGESLARGSIVHLAPSIRGYMVDNHEMPYEDYVLARFTVAVTGKENDRLDSSVFEVSFPFVCLCCVSQVKYPPRAL
jgi:hypothetical protein